MIATLSLFVSMALAGELQVNMDTPVLVYVNGVEVPNPSAILQVTARDLPGGLATVEIRNLLGRVVLQTQVSVPTDQQLRVRYTRKQLLIQGTSPLPAPAPAPVIAVPAPPAARSGSLEIVGFDDHTGSVWVDGANVKYSASADAFVAAGLSPGAHSVRVERERSLRFNGSLEVRADQNNHCLLDSRNPNATLDCFFATPALGSVGSAPVAAPVATPAAIPVPTPAPAAPVTAGPVDVVFVLKDTMDMCNVYVDGARVADFRTGDAEKHVTLNPGTHTIEIRDFTEFETWHKGVLTVSGTDAMRVGFSEDAPVEVYNRSGAWSAK